MENYHGNLEMHSESDASWATVLSGVPRESVFHGPLLFIIFINAIVNGILSRLSSFGGDTKLCRAVVEEDEVGILRKVRVLFNFVVKRVVMHIGKRNKEFP